MITHKNHEVKYSNKKSHEMLVDSHCHLNFPELKNNLDDYIQQMKANKVSHALVISTRHDNIDEVVDIANQYDNLFASVGIHPDEKIDDFVLTEDFLLENASKNKVIAIGETGLDYYWNKDADMSWQHNRFDIHISVAKKTSKPLVVHTRESVADTYSMMNTRKVDDCGAVMHCFTETIEYARKFLDIGCYISLSGIVTFKNAKQVQELAKFVPLDRLLVETDAPYLAPVPFRGQTNHPALVLHTAKFIAELRGCDFEELAAATTQNFFKLFKPS